MINPVVSTSEAEVPDTVNDGTTSDDIRRSNRRRLTYTSSRLQKESLKCRICNEEIREKGRPLPLTLLTFRNQDIKTHEAEETLMKFSNIYVEKNYI